MKLRIASKVVLTAMQDDEQFGVTYYRCTTLQRAFKRLNSRRKFKQIPKYFSAAMTVAFLRQGCTFNDIRFLMAGFEADRQIANLDA